MLILRAYFFYLSLFIMFIKKGQLPLEQMV